MRAPTDLETAIRVARAILPPAIGVVVSLFLPLARGASPGSAEDEDFFEARVRPVLLQSCFKCHGGEKTSRGLRVDSREALLRGGRSGPAIVPGDPGKSLLIQAIRHEHKDVRMPPDKKLPEAAAADIAGWVERGAFWPKASPAWQEAAIVKDKGHWAFEPVRDILPPAGAAGAAENPIDSFISARLRREGLEQVPLADRRTLGRRTYFDLTGLPPEPEELKAFVEDPSPRAYESLVDRLLASPRYGERWGRHWMDVVRYADTAGDNADYPVPESYLYRDYIIDSFSADKPYDQFVEEQLAGDFLARSGPREKYAERVIATGFIALSRRYATAPFELMHLTMEDAIETTGRAFLGLTLRCARCHDHKFDPVTQEDYYALYGIFESTRFPYAGSEEYNPPNATRTGFVPLIPPEEAEPLLVAQRQEIEARQKEIQETEKSLQAELKTPGARKDEAKAELEKKLAPLRDGLSQLKKPGLPSGLPGAYAVADAAPVDSLFQPNGEPDPQGVPIQRGAPKFLAGARPLQIPPGESGRLQLARWLTAPENPLTARVMVNRIWQHHFGKGIVATPSNFGLRGEPPTHPDLLDFLAKHFVEDGWSIKRMHRLILLSRTYRLSSSDDEAGLRKDPGNRLYWKFDRRRLSAEELRDAMMAVGGELDLGRPGRHPFPPVHKLLFSQHAPFKAVYASSHRTVYLMTQRIVRHPYLALFDSPDTNLTSDVRTQSTVPLQSLYLLNDAFVRDQCAALAARVLSARQGTEEQSRLAHELALGRPPAPEETSRAARYVSLYCDELGRTGIPEEQREKEAWTSYARVLLSSNEFIYVD